MMSTESEGWSVVECSWWCYIVAVCVVAVCVVAVCVVVSVAWGCAAMQYRCVQCEMWGGGHYVGRGILRLFAPLQSLISLHRLVAEAMARAVSPGMFLRSLSLTSRLSPTSS